MSCCRRTGRHREPSRHPDRAAANTNSEGSETTDPPSAGRDNYVKTQTTGRLRIDGEWVSLRLTERSRFGVPEGTRAPAHLKGEQLRTWEFIHLRKRRMPAGHFRLQACAGWLQEEWLEVPGGPLEERLNEVVAGLFLLTHSWKELREHRRLEAIRQAKAEEERRQRDLQLERERRRVKRLLELASRWSQIGEATRFLRAVEAAFRRAPSKGVRSDLLARLEWAEATLKGMDPVTEFLDGAWE